MTVACDGVGCRDSASDVPGIFATYSLHAFLNKKQGISPLQQIWYKHHRSRRSSPSGIFIEFLRTSFSNFLGKLVRWFSRATLACRSGGESFRTEIVSPRSKALSKIFENFEPRISEKDGEMKQGNEGQITTAGWPAISNFTRS